MSHCHRAHQDQSQETDGRPHRVDVPASHQSPQQQRIQRPQQVGTGAPGRIVAQQPVQREHDRTEGQRVPQLQPERDPPGRGPAEDGGGGLLNGRQRPVDGMLGLPGQGGVQADRVAGQPQLKGRHHVGVVPDRHHPAVGGIVECVGGPGGREHREYRRHDECRTHQHPGPRPRTPPDRQQPGPHPGCAGDHRRPQGDGHHDGSQVQGDPPGRPVTRAGYAHHPSARPHGGNRDHDQERGTDACHSQPARDPAPGRRYRGHRGYRAQRSRLAPGLGGESGHSGKHCWLVDGGTLRLGNSGGEWLQAGVTRHQPGTS